MAQLVSVKLSRFDSQPWGFRLQGGKDFGTPLAVQKVNGNSLAEKAGLQAGDSVIRVNNVDLFNLTHKEAQNVLVQAGNSFELTVQRGGSTWKPSVTPIGPPPSAVGRIEPVTKTSLAYKQSAPPSSIGSQHNTAAKPFSQVNGESAKTLASKLYNSPIGLYSEETIAETLSAQTEVLAGGVLGVNFKKNEKTYNAANSEVLKMVQEIDNEPRDAEPVAAAAAVAGGPLSAPATPKVSNVAAPTQSPLAGLRHVEAPITAPPSQDPLKVLPPGQNICADCERLIVGLFVRIKDKNLHVECFKCATCGTSLKNVGYYNINNKLYCDVHAKLAARQNPPAPNLEPLTIPPGIKPPSSIIGSALSSAAYQPGVQSPGSPLPGTIAPLPFHAPQSGIRHVNAPFAKASPAAAPSIPAPKLNLGPAPAAPVAAPASIPRPLSDSTHEGGIQYQSFSTVSQSSYAQSENVSFEGSLEEQRESNFSTSALSQTSHKKMSLATQEVSNLHMDTQSVVKQLSEILEQEDRCPSPTPIDEVAKRIAQNLETQVSKEEELQRIEQKLQWSNYKEEGKELVNKHLSNVRESGLSFLRSHSTPVAELEALYAQQQQEIEVQQEKIQKLGFQKRMSIDQTQIQEIECQIISTQNEIILRQEKQKEIEKKKRVRFEEEEEIRRQSKQIDEDDLKELREKQRQQLKRAQDEETELSVLEEERKLLEFHRERARTPVADLEANDRHKEMSKKTETIYHTYEHLVEENEEELEVIEPKPITRPLTPARGVSPFPGSIPGAEVNLLLKNIHGIQSEFEMSNPKKPDPKKFHLPDLSKLGCGITYKPQSTPAQNERDPPQPEQPVDQLSLRLAQEQPQQKIQQQKVVEMTPLIRPNQLPEPSSQRHTQERLQAQQIKEQRKQVHEELALNERFRKKQERLGVQTAPQQQQPHTRFERPKTPVAAVEAEERHGTNSERSQHVYESYDQVLQTAERPRSRIGQPAPEKQSITNAEKSLFFQNISGINYEFENISELTAAKHLPTEQKSTFIRDVEVKTKSPLTVGVNDFSQKSSAPAWLPKTDPFQSPFVQALTIVPDSSATTGLKSYEQFRSEQESLYQRQKQDQQRYFEQQRQRQTEGLVINKTPSSSFVEALTIAPDRPYSPFPTYPPAPEPEETAPPSIQQKPLSEIAPPETSSYDGSRRRSSGFPGVNVQRTAYQMHRGSQIQSAFQEEMKSQETALSQFVNQTHETVSQTSETIAPSLGLLSESQQIAYAPPPPPGKRAELVASQSQFGHSIDIKPEKPRTESKALSKPITLAEALSIAPDRPYSPFPGSKKPEVTLIHGGSSVALTKSVEAIKNATEPPPPPVEIKPTYELRDVQLSKSSLNNNGFTGSLQVEQTQKAEGGEFNGPNSVGSYQRREEKSFSVLQAQSNQMDCASRTEKDASQTVEPSVGCPPIGDQLSAELSQSVSVNSESLEVQKSQTKLSSSSELSVAAITTNEKVELTESARTEKNTSQSEQVQQIGNITKTTMRRVVEERESSHKEFLQVRTIDPVSGLRRTTSDAMLKKENWNYQASSAAGLRKPANIPSYQSSLSEMASDSLPVVASTKAEASAFQPRPRSAIGGTMSRPEATKVPTAFRSRTPVPLPKVEFHQANVQQPQARDRHLPTYNQDQVFRSASPRPIPVPKTQLRSYVGAPPQNATLKPAAQVVYRSKSPVPVPKMVKTSESYQQPVSSWRVQPVKNEKRISWPPEADTAPMPSEVPTVTSKSSVREKIIHQEEKAVMNVEEARRVSLTPKLERPSKATAEKQLEASLPPGSVKAKISQQEQQAIINQEDARRSSVVGVKAMNNLQNVSKADDVQMPLSTSTLAKTSLVAKGYPAAPKPDPIVAPRPFGTPTPQRKIATPHFQPIKPVAITECQNAPITTPKLTFSSSQASTAEMERKSSVSITSSQVSAFKRLDVSPIKPLACKPQAPLVPAPVPNSDPRPTVDCSADAGGPGGRGAVAGASAPRRGRGVLNPPSTIRTPLCAHCNGQVRGPFITALGKIWCPDHFICATQQCRRPLADIGFVEEQGQLYCEFCFEKYIAPHCDKCNSKIKGDCLNAIGKHFHPECFTCAYCGKLFGNAAFFLEDGLPYCENDWNELFTTKCFACGFPIEAGDRWVEALNNNYHSQCFNCTVCKKNLEGQSFFAKGGRPFCKAHAR